MKKNKMSKILLGVLTALFVGVVGMSAASATSFYQSRSVSEMMDRRRNAVPYQTIGVTQPDRIFVYQAPDGQVQRSIIHPQLRRSVIQPRARRNLSKCAQSRQSPQSPQKLCKHSVAMEQVQPVEREVSIELESEPEPLMPVVKRKHGYKKAERPLPKSKPIAFSKHRIPVEEDFEEDLMVQDLEPYEIKDNESEMEAFIVNEPEEESGWGIFSFLKPKNKDGSLFPGGGCANCQKSGPLIDTGPCPSCDDGPLLYAEPCESCGALIDDGPCEKCEEPLLYAEPCESCPTVLAHANPARRFLRVDLANLVAAS